MKIESKTYSINTGKDGNPITADLSHLEKSLVNIGYYCKPSLANLQNAKKGIAKVIPSVLDSSYFEKKGHKVIFIVYSSDKVLDEFASEYDPVPLV